MLPITRSPVISVQRGFFFSALLRMSYAISLRHSLSIPFNNFNELPLSINESSQLSKTGTVVLS